MVDCGPNLQTSNESLVFIPKHGEIAALGSKIERKNTKHQCLGGLRMEYHGVQSSQNFVVIFFASFNCC